MAAKVTNTLKDHSIFIFKSKETTWVACNISDCRLLVLHNMPEDWNLDLCWLQKHPLFSGVPNYWVWFICKTWQLWWPRGTAVTFLCTAIQAVFPRGQSFQNWHRHLPYVWRCAEGLQMSAGRGSCCRVTIPGRVFNLTVSSSFSCHILKPPNYTQWN